jgi:hypothetical protein
MFERESFEGGAIDDAYAARRARNEPIAEITQAKGTSETHPALSPNDEWADFEIMPYRVLTQILSEPPGSYMRDALRRGLAIEDGGVPNPYKLGFIGSSDTHVAAGVFSEEDYTGPSGLMQADGARRGSVPIAAVGDTRTVDDGSGRTFSPTTAITNGGSGLAGVWAEENTRESLFDAMRRKETFATSGPRIRVRFFGRVGIGTLDVDDPSLVSQAYERGVPMGGDLLASDEAGPSFLVWAMRDPLAAPLQRLQVVKGWINEGATNETVYDVACSDPDFDAGERAFYYLRVLENPTCRWSTWDALRAGVEPRLDVSATIQERA